VTSEGSAYARFRRALDARDAFGASAAALELPHVGLADALELTLIYLGQGAGALRAGGAPLARPALYGRPAHDR
jgi:hypothetical protein